jgi:hypothetical protein
MSGGVGPAMGLGCALFGWAPEAAWAATPRDLLLALAARAAMLGASRPVTPLRALEFAALKARLDHA